MEIRKTYIVNLKIAGIISCGESVQYYPEEEQEVFPYARTEIEEDSEHYYLLKCNGDSMKEADICDGDLILVEKAITANVGDVVVALDENGGTTLKRLSKDKSGVLFLHPENSDKDDEGNYIYKDLYKKNIIIQGIARSIIKRGCR